MNRNSITSVKDDHQFIIQHKNFIPYLTENTVTIRKANSLMLNWNIPAGLCKNLMMIMNIMSGKTQNT
jgi:hypothetical protein